MTTEYTKPFPPITDLNRPYFEAGAEGVIKLQSCNSCGNIWFPAAEHCPRCLEQDYEWKPMSGRATLWSWVVMHQVYFKSFKDDVPYVVAFVQLEEGPFMMSTVTGVDREALKRDMPLRATFVPAKEGSWLPVFEPAA
ncbi:OB-fold domain-containing protein [Sphingobium sp. Sx8-8]|uniref:Zn-ribbon domain-containing OB-fold protein n=1 Tax=Sphingobium sp. Sx8-8 TaxID=2933617 RepID=UPI001F55AE43|nr:OB-fold domain-containing protein [Sphingobium sp. Sx8-8]